MVYLVEKETNMRNCSTEMLRRTLPLNLALARTDRAAGRPALRRAHILAALEIRAELRGRAA